ncbi:MAG: hypothetical protein JWN31_2224 [Frankiales bacterium]|nr:hypothetical protein [Frankiales bacterium]
MGTMTTLEYDISDGQEWVDYFNRISGECRRLVAEGRMPDTEAVDGFLADSAALLRQVKEDIATARSRGAKTAITAVNLTAEEHRRLIDIRESVLNLLQILEMRGAVQLDRTEGVGRMVAALTTGTFS